MARVRVCPICGGENTLSVIRYTQCGVSVAHISLTEAAPLALAASTEQTPDSLCSMRGTDSPGECGVSVLRRVVGNGSPADFGMAVGSVPRDSSKI